eukprot:GHVO01032167.1.p1 GENE.GHVO01032167.1~~GHVO01032167.1.p1  ORF type:complete len:200 (-),score=1.21 GHVO01032167.1:528-1127(-)
MKVNIGEDSITPSTVVRNLGAWLDTHVDMREQVKRTAKAGYQHLRTIARVRRYLDPDSSAKAINATVTSRLDYHNGLLAGAPQCVLKPLQRLQNNAARVLTRTNRREHITPVLEILHWLPIKERTDYKMMTLIHNALHNENAPAYMKEMFCVYRPTRPLRSAEDHWTLEVNPAARHKRQRSATVYGESVWNTLPAELRS